MNLQTTSTRKARFKLEIFEKNKSSLNCLRRMGRANLVFKKSYKPIMEEWITFMHKKVGLHNRTENLKKFPPPAVFEPTIISRFCPCLCRREIQKNVVCQSEKAL